MYMHIYIYICILRIGYQYQLYCPCCCSGKIIQTPPSSGVLADFCREMFPRLRVFLFDARQVFSAPITVFGPNLAVVYVGQFYLAFREGQRVRSLTDHFDWLVREATVDARNVADHILSLTRK